MNIRNMIVCNKCGKSHYPMDMHDKEVCKACWLKEYRSKFRNRTTKMVETKKNKLLSG